MNLKKYGICLSVILLCGCHAEAPQRDAYISPTTPPVSGELKVSVLKVGKADAIILQTENHSAVIDCGEADDGKEILKYLSKNGIPKIDYLFITHFDKDHVGGAAEVLNGTETGQIITPSYTGSNDEYYDYINAAEENSLTPLTLTENMTFILDDALFEVYPPEKASYAEGDNDFSLAVSVSHGDNRFLFAGDAEQERLGEILTQINGEYDFLKVPHHGRFNAATQKFVDAVKPSYSVITCSEKNPPEEQTLNILEKAGSEIYLTSDGNITAVSDGTGISIKQS